MVTGGCNTIAGVGEDVSAAGQTVADWASPDDKQ
jgi:predicted small secreted protein